MRFAKMHGLGNDYVFADGFTQRLPEDLNETARRVSAPHTGIGADGLIVMLPCETADARMRIFNADGSEAQICGNGLRCVGKYLYESGLCAKNQMRIETGAGARALWLDVRDARVDTVTVDMGKAEILDQTPVAVRGVPLTRVLLGNPHAVACERWIDDESFYQIAPALERDPIFPERSNIEFARAVASNQIQMRVWERGSGETQACGSGACAVFAAYRHLGLCDADCEILLPRGSLRLRMSESSHVLMRGGATYVCSGVWDESDRVPPLDR